MRWRLVGIAFVIVGVITAAVGVLELTTEAVWRRGEYPDIARARAAGEVERGWIPSWVPEEAHTIKAVHNTDSGMRWVAFTVEPVSIGALRVILEREGFRTVALSSPTLSPVFRSRLRIVVPPELVPSFQFLWRAPEGARYGEYVAIRPEAGQVFVWSQPL
jgi:hypothetical protein